MVLMQAVNENTAEATAVVDAARILPLSFDAACILPLVLACAIGPHAHRLAWCDVEPCAEACLGCCCCCWWWWW